MRRGTSDKDLALDGQLTLLFPRDAACAQNLEMTLPAKHMLAEGQGSDVQRIDLYLLRTTKWLKLYPIAAPMKMSDGKCA